MLANYTIEGFENIQYQGYARLKFTEDNIMRFFQSYAYTQVETPMFEAYDFYSQNASINGDDLFKLVNSSGKVLALKPDATLPIARMAAINHHDPEEIIKFCYLTNIYRDFGASEITKKETTQMGVEYFGSDSPGCEAEVIALAIGALREANIKNVHIDMGHAGYLAGLLKGLPINIEDKRTITNCIEHKNIGDLKDWLAGRPDLPEDLKKILLRIPMLYGKPEKVFPEMRSLAVNPEMIEVVDRLEAVYNILNVMGLADCIHLELGFTSRMNYYSGLVFKGYIEDLGEPVISGGRYNGLCAKFGIDRPACGFGLDVLLLFDYLERNELLPNLTNNSSVVLCYPEQLKEGEALWADTRKASMGQPVEFFVMTHKQHGDKESGSPEAFVARLLKNPNYENCSFTFVGENGCETWNGTAFEQELR